jgi:hypothetical protein
MWKACGSENDVASPWAIFCAEFKKGAKPILGYSLLF